MWGRGAVASLHFCVDDSSPYETGQTQAENAAQYSLCPQAGVNCMGHASRDRVQAQTVLTGDASEYPKLRWAS